MRQRQFATFELEKPTDKRNSSSGEEKLYPIVGGKPDVDELWLRKNEVLNGEQALLVTVLKKLRGCLEYGEPRGPKVKYICGVTMDTINIGQNSCESDRHKGIRLIFTPPAPEEPSVDDLLADLRDETCMSKRAMELVKQIVEAGKK